MKIFKVSVFLILLQCIGCKEMLGASKPGKFQIGFNIACAVGIWKLLPLQTWTKYSTSFERFYGLSNGVCWYPVNVNEKNLKIGFFCLEHRSCEVLVALSRALWSKAGVLGLFSSVVLFPLSLSLFSLKWKYLRINMFSVLELYRIFYASRNQQGTGFLSPFFTHHVSRNDYFVAEKWPLILFFLFPRLSIDLSWGDQN